MENMFARNFFVPPKKPIRAYKSRETIRQSTIMPREPGSQVAPQNNGAGMSPLQVRIPIVPRNEDDTYPFVSNFLAGEQSSVRQDQTDAPASDGNTASSGTVLPTDADDKTRVAALKQETADALNLRAQENRILPTPDNTTPFYNNLLRPDAEPLKWMVPGILAAGGHPLYHANQPNLNYLRKAGIKAVITAFEKPLDHKYLEGMEYWFIPTLTGYSSHLYEACEFIDRMEQQKKPVFVHGFTWSDAGTIIAAYIAYKNWETMDGAIAYVRNTYSRDAISRYCEGDLYRMGIDL